MDIGGVGGNENEERDWTDSEWAQWARELVQEEVPVDGVNTQCHNSSGYGHFARECPTKGKGKGNPSNPKGKSKGKGKDAKGKGKAGKGPVCWNCQKPGHIAANCPLTKGVGNVEGEEIINDSQLTELDAGGVF